MEDPNKPAGQWILMESFDAGARRKPVPDYDNPISHDDAFAMLEKVEHEYPGRDFFIRRLAEVQNFE